MLLSNRKFCPRDRFGGNDVEFRLFPSVFIAVVNTVPLLTQGVSRFISGRCACSLVRAFVIKSNDSPLLEYILFPIREGDLESLNINDNVMIIPIYSIRTYIVRL